MMAIRGFGTDFIITAICPDIYQYLLSSQVSGLQSSYILLLISVGISGILHKKMLGSYQFFSH